MMRGINNCGYIVSKQGILKLLSLSLGLISTGCIFGGYQKAVWFQETPHFFMSPADDCESDWEEVEPKLRETLMMKPCPLEMLIVMPGVCTAFYFLVSIILYLVFLRGGLLPKNPRFRQVDLDYHLVAGVSLVISALSIFVYVGRSFDYVESVCSRSFKLARGHFKIENCRRDSLTDIFRVWTFGLAGVLTSLNALVYLTVGLVIKRSQR